jgi:Na+-transporting methylmalonyl-CoA/oxaloacetate decarboxylase gamma subunit
MDPQSPTPPANNQQNNLHNQGLEPQPVVPPTNTPPASPANYTAPGTIEPLEPDSLSPQSEIPTAVAQPASQLPPVDSPSTPVTPPGEPQHDTVPVPPAVQKPKSKTGLIIGIVVAVVVVPVVLLFLMIVVLAVQGAQKAKRDTEAKNAALNSASQDSSSSTTTATGSVADAKLTEDILKYVYISESSKGNASSNITVNSVKLISQTSKQVVEEWSMTVGTTKVVYTVTISPTADGGSDFAVLKKS